MNEFDATPIRPAANIKLDGKPGSLHSTHGPTQGIHDTDRIVELEIENSRLHRLVAELLIKNEQLRKTD